MTPECEAKGLDARRVADAQDVEMLRWVRNACKDGFAHDNVAISEQAQRAWWVVNRDTVKAWLYWRDGTMKDAALGGVTVVGYGLVRQTHDGRWWSSVAVLPLHGGHGYGGAITADLVRRMEEPVWGQARLDQPAAMRLHRAADWEEVERDDRLATYRTMPHVYDGRLAEWAARGWVTA